MFEVTLPVIPEEYGKENTIELYWEVNETTHPYDWGVSYNLYLMNKHIVTVPERQGVFDVINPAKRWWNRQPEHIREVKVTPSHQKETISIIKSHHLSDDLDFSAKDVYDASESILLSLKNKAESSKLIGKYPPKTLDLDPSLLNKE